MTPNNNLSVLPFYDAISRQNHRKEYAFGNIYPLYTPIRTILPFQIIIPTTSSMITSVNLYDGKGTNLGDITTAMFETGLEKKSFYSDGYDIIFYPGILPINFDTRKGLHYLKIIAGQIWYSEMFTFVDNVNRYLKIQWWDKENMYVDGGHIDYSPPFKHTLYLNTELGKPEYPFIEEGNDRDGYFFPEKQISEKTFKFVFLSPEYLLDAIRIIRLSDHIQVTNHGQLYDCDTFLITPRWQQGDIASVDAEFQCGTIVKKLGRAITRTIHGDFNNDFNDDFNI